MEAKDIMIGDLVYRMDKKVPVPIKIIGIEVANYDGMEYVVDVLNKYEHNIHLYLDEIGSIPLTTEILKKNGFVEKSERRWVLSDEYTGDEVLVLYEVANGFAMTTEGMTIGFQNVHELQHLFKLCGITKEIEL